MRLGEAVISETNASWPEERRPAREGRDPTRAYFARRREEALDALAHIQFSEGAITAIAAWLRQQREAGARLPDRGDLGKAVVSMLARAGLSEDVAKLLDTSGDDGVLDDVNPAAAAAIARAAMLLLQDGADRWNWALISSLRQRGNRLGPALSQLLDEALKKEAFRARFFELAESLVAAAVTMPEQKVMTSEREIFTRLIQDWCDEPALLELWFGLRGLNYVHYFGDEAEILRRVARLDSFRFMDLLGRFDNPYQVWAALDHTRAASSFEEWRALVHAAPVAFRQDGSWTGSTILPLLLVIALQAVAQGAAPFARYETAEAAQEGGRGLSDAAEAVAAALLAREDGASAALRWAAWLARSVASASAEGAPVPTDARHRAFAPWQLLSAVAQRAGWNFWGPVDPPDLPIEETWFSLMAKVVSIGQSSDSAEDHAQLLAAFVAPWPDEDPEAWEGGQGARLMAESGVVRTFARQPTTLPVRILAIPLTMAPDPVAALIDLWRKCAVLREAVEFGELRLFASSNDEDPCRAAAQLCWLALDLGLCMIDQIADSRIPITCDRSMALERLFPMLWQGIAEMISIDRFGSDIGDRMRRHLILRRALFAVDGDEGPESRVVSSATLPTLAGMLRALAAVERSFFLSLIALLDAGITATTLRNTLIEGAIDLSMLLGAAERVNAIDQRRPMLDPTHLERLRQIA